MIRPTLFIGLGTTGTKILKQLRELMSEEYGRAGLPIFRYIAIETDGAMEAENTNQMKGYEQINLVSATTDNFDSIKLKLDPNDPNYSPQWADWLNPDLLNFALNFKAGAANIRMAGRLCLWENWDEMRETVLKAHAAIIAPATTKEANSILSQHCKTKGLPDDNATVGGNIHIYLVGSLCGGTCSGMLIDMAYFCRNLIAGKDGNEVHGIFTMHDKAIAATAAAQTAVHAANCYGGLWELNYYNHPKTHYDVIFPDNLKATEPFKNPYDDIKLVSRSSVNPNYKFVDQHGNFDEDGLNLMIALHLFAETAGNTFGLKKAIGIDGKALPKFGSLQVGKNNKNTVMSRTLASFGLTAVWYPKYRIASASAALVNQRLSEKWIASNSPEINIVNDAKKEWQNILGENIQTLTNPKGLQPLKGQIGKLLRGASTKFQSAPAAALKGLMQNYPEDEAFKEKFEGGGEYFELMEMQKPVCKGMFLNSVEKVFSTQLDKLEHDGTYGIGDVQVFFENLDKEIEKTIEKEECPTLAPSLDLNQLDFDAISRAENNRWTKLIGLHDQSVNAHRQALIDKYGKLISESSTSIYISLRNYFLRSILQEIREELGFGVTPREADGPNPHRTIKQRLDQIVDNLRGCIQRFKDDYAEAIDPRKAECVMIVTNNEDNKIDTDAENLSRSILKAAAVGPMLNGGTIASFLEKDQDDIVNQMTENFRRLALRQIQSHDVVEEVQKHLGSGSPEIPNLSRRSNPYQTFRTTYQPLVPIPPKIIFGRDTIGNVLPNLQGTLGFTHHGNSSVDHLLFFYQEDFGFATDDLDVFQTLKDHYDKTPPPGRYGHLTHQNPDFYNLELGSKTNRLARWCKVLSRLVPAICNRINDKAFAGVFRLDYGRYVFEYYVDGSLQTLGLYDDPDGIKRLSRMGNAESYDKFIRDVQEEFSLFVREQIAKEIIEPLLHKVEDLSTRNKLSDYYNQFLDEVYSENNVPETTDIDTELDAHFSHPPPQTESGDTSTPQTQEVVNDNAENPTVDLDTYGNDATEESEVDAGTFMQDDTEQNQETSQDTPTEHSTSDATEDEYKWSEVTPEAEPAIKEETTDEEYVSEQPQPETEAQKKQAQPAKPFNVADVNVKQVSRRDNAPKKE
ncbi:MAG: hypothetical protein OXI67_13085 [Candidatus Poribacteria bacterium]|nr:hypothetical protein [Candidatus Poribacteria bacterium]